MKKILYLLASFISTSIIDKYHMVITILLHNYWPHILYMSTLVVVIVTRNHYAEWQLLILTYIVFLLVITSLSICYWRCQLQIQILKTHHQNSMVTLLHSYISNWTLRSTWSIPLPQLINYLRLVLYMLCMLLLVFCLFWLLVLSILIILLLLLLLFRTLLLFLKSLVLFL